MKMKENLRAKHRKRTISVVVLLAPVFIVPWFLIYFKVDETAATTLAKAFQFLEKLEVGAKCLVKENWKESMSAIVSSALHGGAYLLCTNCRLVALF